MRGEKAFFCAVGPQSLMRPRPTQHSIFESALLFFAVWLLVCGIMIARMWRKAKRNTANLEIKDQLQNANVLYQDSRSSGRSLKNLKTRCGGAHNCLKIVVTDDRLYITAPGILAALSNAYDLEHSIPKSAVEAMEVREHWLSRTSYRITYSDTAGGSHTLELVPRRKSAFDAALGVQFMAGHK